MHINTGDKFVTVKKIWFINEGTEITVTNVDEDGIVSFAFGENNTSNGYMDSITFAKHFEKVVDDEEDAVFEITDEQVAEIMENSEFETFTAFDKCTIVSCRLPNGFVITESSACVSPENYDEDLGADICFDKIAEKIRELEAYRLQQWMWEEKMVNIPAEDCPCDCDNCDECSCDGEICSESSNDDVDCECCNDYECPYNSIHFS